MHGCYNGYPQLKKRIFLLVSSLDPHTRARKPMGILASYFVSKVVNSCLAVCCFPITASKAWRKSKSKHLFCTMQEDDILTCPKPIIGTVLCRKFRIIRCLLSDVCSAKTAVSPCSSPLWTFREEERLRLSDRNSIDIDVVKSVWNPVRCADWSTEKLHCFSYCLRMTDKVNAMNL